MRWLRRLALLLVLGGIGYAIARSMEAQPLEVEVASLSEGPLREVVEDDGRTRVRERFVVSAPISGFLSRIELEPGDVVSVGQVLASIDPVEPEPLDARRRGEAEARLKGARAALSEVEARAGEARAALELAQWELGRAEELRRQGSATEQLVRQREAEVEVRRQQLQAAEFAMKVAGFAVEQAEAALVGSGPRSPESPEEGGRPSVSHRVRSPIQGAVLDVIRESEGVIPAGTPLLELGDPRALEIVSDLLSTEAVRVEAGQEVEVPRWGGEGTLRAVVRRVEPRGFTKVSALGVEEQRVNIVCDLTDPKERWAALRDGFGVDVRVVVWRTERALLAPSSALFRRGDRWAAFIVEGGRAAVREVEVGHSDGRRVEVLSGLSVSDQVVVFPGDQLADGSEVVTRPSRGE